MVDCLLEVGGQQLLSIKNNDGETCLFLSAQNGNVAVVKRLVRAGRRELILQTRICGTSCLLTFISMQEWDIASMLLIVGGPEVALLQQLVDGTSCMRRASAYGEVAAELWRPRPRHAAQELR